MGVDADPRNARRPEGALNPQVLPQQKIAALGIRRPRHKIAEGSFSGGPMKRRAFRRVFAVALLIFAVFAGVRVRRVARLARQKHAAADMATIGNALEAYASEHGGVFPEPPSTDELWRLLSPKYINVLRKDGWGADFKYVCWHAPLLLAVAIITRS